MVLLKKKQIRVYDLLAGLFVMTLIVSNIASTKMVAVGPLVFDAGTVLFPLAYIVGDMVTEVYGFRKMRSLLYVGITTLLLTMLTFWVVQLLPAASDWHNQAAYDATLGVVWRIAFASMVAIFIGELINAYILASMKIHTKGAKLWQRLIGSSAVGSLIDTALFSILAFAGTMSNDAMIHLIATVFAIKVATEVIISPVTVKLIERIKRHERIDTYEKPAAYLVD